MNNLLNKRLIRIEPLTKREAEKFWPGATWGYEGNVVLVFEGGARLVASQDPEGNGPGCMFGRDGKDMFTLVAPRKRASGGRG